MAGGTQAHRENYLTPRDIHRLVLVLVADSREDLGSYKTPPAQAAI